MSIKYLTHEVSTEEVATLIEKDFHSLIELIPKELRKGA